MTLPLSRLTSCFNSHNCVQLPSALADHETSKYWVMLLGIGEDNSRSFQSVPIFTKMAPCKGAYFGRILTRVERLNILAEAILTSKQLW